MQNNFGKKAYNFKWLDIYDPDENELKALAQTLNIAQSAVIDCLQPEHLPKFENFENFNFIILRFFDPNCKPKDDSVQAISRKLAVFYNHDTLLTIHRSKAEWVQNLKNKYANNPIINSPFDMVCKLIKNGLESYESPLVVLDREIDFFESRIFLKKKVPNLLKSLYYIKRRTFMFKRLLSLTKVISEHIIVYNKRNSVYEDMKDYYVKVETINDEIYDSILSLLNIYISISSQRTNEVMRLLTVFSAFFLPLTFIVGVYGMNFNFMPELESKFGYPAVLITMLVITILIYIWFRRKGLI